MWASSYLTYCHLQQLGGCFILWLIQCTPVYMHMAFFIMQISVFCTYCFNSLWSSDAIWRHRSGKETENWPRYSKFHLQVLNTLWPSDVIWPHRSRSTLAQVMACCLMAPSHYLNQCWLLISEVLWHSPDSNFTENTEDIYRWNQFEIY